MPARDIWKHPEEIHSFIASLSDLSKYSLNITAFHQTLSTNNNNNKGKAYTRYPYKVPCSSLPLNGEADTRYPSHMCCYLHMCYAPFFFVVAPGLCLPLLGWLPASLACPPACLLLPACLPAACCLPACLQGRGLVGRGQTGRDHCAILRACG